MATPENGGVKKAAVSLSALQAALRKPAVAKAPAKPGGAVPPQGQKRPLAAVAGGAAVAGSPLKKVIVKSASGAPMAKAAAAKTPVGKAPAGIMKSPAPGGLAKAPGGGLGTAAKSAAPGVSAKGAAVAASGALAKAPGSFAKSPGVLSKAPGGGAAIMRVPGTTGKAVPPGAPPAAGAPLAPDAGLSLAVVGDIVATIEAASGNAKIRSVVRLADALGHNLQIEHINHFLRALKKKVVERATTDGVRVPMSAKAPAPAAAPAATAAAAAGAAIAARPSQPGPGAPKQPPVGAMTAAKSPLAKAPVAKAPVAKAPLAKTPVPGVPAAAKPKPAQPPAQPRPAAAPAATPASSPAAGCADDQLYTLVGELTESPVVVDGAVDDARLGEVLKRLWDGVARKPKDWVAGWHAMSIPVDKQGVAMQKLLNMAFVAGGDIERAPMIIAEIVKGHRIKMRSVEEVLVAFGHNLDGILALNEEAWQIYAYFLMHIFPKPANAGWGWSRVGWSWTSWWKYVEQCISSLEASRSSEVVCMIMRLIQEREGQAIQEVQAWSEGDKLSKVVAKIAELDQSETTEAVEKLAAHGVAIQI